MKTTRRAAFLSGISLLGAYAQLAPNQNVTSGFTNGRLWSILDLNSKRSFLVGCRDAFLLGSMTVTGDYSKIPDQLQFPSLMTDEVINELDSLYAEGANKPIPIVLALGYVKHKASGDTPEQLQELLASLRRIGNR